MWINPYIAQRSALFEEGRAGGFLVTPRRRRRSGRRTCGRPGWGWSTSPTPDAVAWYQAHLRRLVGQGVDAFKTDFGERIPTDVVWHDGSDPRADAQLLHAALQPGRVRPAGGGAGAGGGGAVRAVRDRRRPAVPGALGRRLRVDVRLDGRVAARRAVAGGVGVRVLEPRHRRLRGHPGPRGVQAVARVRAAVLAQPAARVELLPGAVGVRRGGRRRHAAVHPPQALADALPGRGRRRGAPATASR